jgi:hypothetical protein
MSESCPLLEAKRTWLERVVMSAFDPDRTRNGFFAGLFYLLWLSTFLVGAPRAEHQLPTA